MRPNVEQSTPNVACIARTFRLSMSRKLTVWWPMGVSKLDRPACRLAPNVKPVSPVASFTRSGSGGRRRCPIEEILKRLAQIGKCSIELETVPNHAFADPLGRRHPTILNQPVECRGPDADVSRGFRAAQATKRVRVEVSHLRCAARQSHAGKQPCRWTPSISLLASASWLA
jgi:hypothetical protein